jgi:hypothetical protein
VKVKLLVRSSWSGQINNFLANPIGEDQRNNPDSSGYVNSCLYFHSVSHDLSSATWNNNFDGILMSFDVICAII